MDKIHCPKCNGKLRQLTYQKIKIYRCTSCYGIWLDALEAEKLKELKGSENLDIGNPETGDGSNNLEDDIICPTCNVKMNTILDIDRHSIWYEKCPKCDGIWFDAGEFKKFKENFQRSTLLNRAKKVFRQ